MNIPNFKNHTEGVENKFAFTQEFTYEMLLFSMVACAIGDDNECPSLSDILKNMQKAASDLFVAHHNYTHALTQLTKDATDQMYDSRLFDDIAVKFNEAKTALHRPTKACEYIISCLKEKPRNRVAMLGVARFARVAVSTPEAGEGLMEHQVDQFPRDKVHEAVAQLRYKLKVFYNVPEEELLSLTFSARRSIDPLPLVSVWGGAPSVETLQSVYEALCSDDIVEGLCAVHDSIRKAITRAYGNSQTN